MTPFLAVSIFLSAGLLGLALGLEERRRRAPSLPDPLQSCPATTALLPVRDERDNVLDCLDSLLAQTAAPKVRVVDDSSTDGTAELVRRRLATEPRLTLLSAGPLPDGWRGKVNALRAGAEGVETPWLLLADADARLAPDLLARAHAAAAGRRLDAVSLAGFQEARGLGENLLTPAVFGLLDSLLGDWEAAAEGKGPPVANGQFILLRREALESCGGFASVRGDTLDDVAIVTGLRARGFHTGFVRAPGLGVRMYRGSAEAIRGWRRNLGGLLGPHLGRVAAVLTVLLLPPLGLVAALAGGRWVEATLLWCAGAAASMLVRSGSGHRPAYGLLYPLDALLLAGVLLLGTVDRRRGRLATWKGREIRV